MFYTLNLSLKVAWSDGVIILVVGEGNYTGAAQNNISLSQDGMLTFACFRYKPALASSEAGEGRASNAVDGIPTIVHEGRKCSETKSEKSPWWTVDLLTVQVTSS